MNNSEFYYKTSNLEDIIPDKKSFQIACKYGNLEMAKYLYSIDKNVYTTKACRLAFENNHLEIVKWINIIQQK